MREIGSGTEYHEMPIRVATEERGSLESRTLKHCFTLKARSMKRRVPQESRAIEIRSGGKLGGLKFSLTAEVSADEVRGFFEPNGPTIGVRIEESGTGERNPVKSRTPQEKRCLKLRRSPERSPVENCILVKNNAVQPVSRREIGRSGERSMLRNLRSREMWLLESAPNRRFEPRRIGLGRGIRHLGPTRQD